MARVIYVCMNELLSGTQTVDYRAGGRSENLRGGGGVSSNVMGIICSPPPVGIGLTTKLP